MTVSTLVLLQGQTSSTLRQAARLAVSVIPLEIKGYSK